MKTRPTIAQDWWDLLSFKEYGSEFYLDQLIEANPDQRLTMRFDAGHIVNVPAVEPQPIAGLAPWRRVLKIR